ATTDTGRSAPPMITPPESKGEAFPKSRTNPVFFDLLAKVIVGPAFPQRAGCALPPGIPGVADAESPPSRRISTWHGDVAEPQVFAALQKLCAFPAAHTSFFGFFFSPLCTSPVSTTGAMRIPQITN